MAVLVIGLVIVVVVMATTAGQHQKQLDRRESLARALDGRALDNGVRCTRDHLEIDYRFTDRGAGSYTEHWTEVAAELPAAYPLELHVKRGRTDPEAVRRGEVIDVEVGHPIFDPTFHVEGAPSDVITHLLDPEACAFLMSYGSVELSTVSRDGRRWLRFATVGWLEAPEAAQPIVVEVARIARRLREVYARLDEAHRPREIGGPYRPDLDDRPAREAAAVREAELAQLAALRVARADEAFRRQVVIWVMLGVVIVVVIATVAS